MGRRRRSRSRPKARTGRRKVRYFYFGLAAVWGYTMGAAAFAVAGTLVGAELRLSPLLVGVTVPGLLLAVLGGVIAAAAYRQNRRQGS